MKMKIAAALCVLLLGFTSGLFAQNTAPGATTDRDIWGDTWFPEWNTDGDTAGFRNSVPVDRNPPTVSVSGDTLQAVKFITDLGEDRWDRGAFLVFGWDGTAFVRFGMWQTPGGGRLKNTTQTMSFTIPAWVKGQVRWEYWSWYGAVSNITNFFYNPVTSTWINRPRRSHLSVASGITGIDTTTLRPTKLTLSSAPATPTASVTPSASDVTLGDSLTFTLSSSGTLTGATFEGSGVSVSGPTPSVTVTPAAAGPQAYKLTVPGGVSLSWGFADLGATVTLNTPKGPIDVTRAVAFPASGSVGGWGVYTITQTNKWGVSETSESIQVDPAPDGVGLATINVLSVGLASLDVVPNARCWVTGATYTAYLARHDVVMHGAASANGGQSIASVELQAMNPKDGVWQTVDVPRTYSGVPSADITFAFSIDTVLGGATDPSNLVPRDPSLVGVWRYRLHVLMQSGRSAYSSEQQVNVVLPIKTQSLVAQTLPEVGKEGWFSPSPGKTYSFDVLIP